MATMAPPMNTGWVNMTAPANMLRVSVRKASTTPMPNWSSVPASAPKSPASFVCNGAGSIEA